MKSLTQKKQKRDNYLREAYNTFRSNSIAESIAQVHFYSAGDKNFIQIGLRKQIPVSDFYAANVTWDVYFKDIARSIAVSEKDYLIKTALSVASKKVVADEDGFSVIFDQIHENRFYDPILFVSVEYFYKTMFQNKVNDIEYDNDQNRFIFYAGNLPVPVFLFTTEELEGKIILADRDGIKWDAVLGDSFDEQANRLKTDYAEDARYVDFTFKTVSRIIFVQKPVILELPHS